MTYKITYCVFAIDHVLVYFITIAAATGAIFSLQFTKKCLAAGLRPDPLGEFERSPRPPSRKTAFCTFIFAVLLHFCSCYVVQGTWYGVRGSNCPLARAMDDHIMRCGTIGSCQSAATSEIVKHCWSRVHSCSCKWRYSKCPDLYLYLCVPLSDTATAA